MQERPQACKLIGRSPEVSAQAPCRRFTASEKAKIRDDYDVGSVIERAALCRRERVYSWLLSN